MSLLKRTETVRTGKRNGQRHRKKRRGYQIDKSILVSGLNSKVGGGINEKGGDGDTHTKLHIGFTYAKDIALRRTGSFLPQCTLIPYS